MPKNRSIKRLKQDAKQLKKVKNVPLNQALNSIAEKQGYQNWQELVNDSNQFKNPTSLEISKNNKELLTKYGIDFSTLIVTGTGLNKSIMDAVASLRHFLQEKSYHNYDNQEQGTDNKVLNECYLISPHGLVETKVSFYRPNTKKGDPRVWVYHLKGYANPSDEIAFFIVKSKLYVVNLCAIDLSLHLSLLSELSDDLDAIAIELRDKLIEIASKPLKAIMKGDTAVGMTVEHALGLPANSSKKPDYKGIELKSGRITKSKNRKNLFAQVANWAESKIRSSKELVENYGYFDSKNGDQRLYCTTNAVGYNSQGLRLKVDIENDKVYEEHITDGTILVWEGQQLRERLLEKHHETFWVSAKVKIIDGEEEYNLQNFTHTKDPIAHQLLPLIQQGVITLDHSIKKKSGTGKTSEKGPFFKIKPDALDLLFPEPVIYPLIDE